MPDKIMFEFLSAFDGKKVNFVASAEAARLKAMTSVRH